MDIIDTLIFFDYGYRKKLKFFQYTFLIHSLTFFYIIEKSEQILQLSNCSYIEQYLNELFDFDIFFS